MSTEIEIIKLDMRWNFLILGEFGKGLEMNVYSTAKGHLINLD